MVGRNIGRQVDINLIGPEERGGSRTPRSGGVFTLLLIVAILFLLPIIWLLLDMKSSSAALTRRLATVQASLSQATVVPAEVTALQAQVDAAQKKANLLDADMTSIASQRIAWGTAAQAIWNNAGPNVAIGSIQTDGRRATVKGDAAGLDAVVGYSDQLRSTGLFNNVVIELVTSKGTPLPGPTSASTATPSVTATPTSITTTTTPEPSWTGTPPPGATYTPQPTYTPYPTYTRKPTNTLPPVTWAPNPPPPLPHTATPVPQPHVSIRLRQVQFSPINLAVGGLLKVEATIENLGNVAMLSQDDPAPGFTYDQGQSSPAGQPGRWRFAADQVLLGGNQNMRYRWGLGGTLQPGQSRHITGYIRLQTPGTFTYCVGAVQEFVNWWSFCEAATTIVVGGSSAPTATPTTHLLPTTTATPSPTQCSDGYEPDSTYQQARVIGTNTSLAQAHNFHAFGDLDWIKFAVSPNITYTLQTTDLRNGADTVLTLYGNDGGILYQLAQNDEDPANALLNPPLVGPSRISYRFTTTETTRFGTTFYARVHAPNPANFGCTKSYKLSLTRPVVYAPAGPQLASYVSDIWRDRMVGQSDMPLAELRDEQLAAAAPRVGFTIILELRGGGP